MFYPGQPVVTRANNRTLRYGPDEWVRNGDRWTVNAGTSDEMYLTNTDTGDRLALPAEYIDDGNVTVNYASTIHRAQGATVDEAHVIIGDRTNNRQLYVAATRGRRANHIHVRPPAFDHEQHGPNIRSRRTKTMMYVRVGRRATTPGRHNRSARPAPTPPERGRRQPIGSGRGRVDTSRTAAGSAAKPTPHRRHEQVTPSSPRFRSRFPSGAGVGPYHRSNRVDD